MRVRHEKAKLKLNKSMGWRKAATKTKTEQAFLRSCINLAIYYYYFCIFLEANFIQFMMNFTFSLTR